MARKVSVVAIVFGIANILMALVPPVFNTFSVIYVLREPPWPVFDIQNPQRQFDLAPPIWQHIHKELPSYKPEVIGSSLCNAFLSLLLIAGAVGLFLNHDWGRWTSVGAAVLMICTFCVHDAYQLGVVRSSLTPAVERAIPPGNPGAAEGNRVGFQIFWFFWCWVNPILILYLLAMAITLTLTRLLGGAPVQEERERWGSRRRRDDD